MTRLAFPSALGVALAVGLAASGCKDVPAAPTCPGGLPPMPTALATASGSAAGASPPASPPAPGAFADDGAPIEFVRAGAPRRSFTKEALRKGLPLDTFTIADGYYDGRSKSWRGIPLRAVLERGFDAPSEALEREQFVLRCADGYTVPVDGKRLLEEGGYLALADADVPAWEPVGPKRDNPGPYFVAWRGKAQQDLEAYPRPYQLAAIELASFESTFPHVLPDGEPEGSPARLGLALFKEQCFRCHAVNREGGRVGPELNVPRSVTEYRPEATLRAFIRNPRNFRYSAMPSHEHLTDVELDRLLAYLKAMSRRKHDPETAKDANRAEKDGVGAAGGAKPARERGPKGMP